jgi:3-vinyl bacteriochlorophyllide hydratase
METSINQTHQSRPGLYSPEQRLRRDASKWTLVQGVLAPIQFLVCLISIVLVLRFLSSGAGELIAHQSILLKTVLLLTIMVTGCLWEHDVYGQFLFAPAFFWEDVVSMVVISLHLTYVAGLMLLQWNSGTLMWIALAAYTTYLINAAQFVWKLRQARLQAKTGTHAPLNSASLQSAKGSA